MERQTPRSVKITWTGGGRERSTSSSQSTALVKPDYHDLGYRPSHVDVHRCSSASCTVCRGTVNLNTRLPRISSTDLIPEAYKNRHDYKDDDDGDGDDDDVNDARDDVNVRRGRGGGQHRGQHRGNISKKKNKGKKYSSRCLSPITAAVLDTAMRDEASTKGQVASPHVKFVRVSNSRNMRDWHNYSDERLRVLSKTTSSVAPPERPAYYEEERNRRWVFL